MSALLDPALKNDADWEIGQSRSGGSSERPEFQFERPDWTLFRNADTLSQKAGVPKTRLRRLVLKELTDNELDSGATQVLVGYASSGAYYVHGNGPGIAGTPEEIARLFSINRPLLSSKLWRLPTRGAMGNGLRVVVGAVTASRGHLRIWTRNRKLLLTPRDDGTTAVVAEEADFPTGTRIEVGFGPGLPSDPDALMWAEAAIRMAAGGPAFAGRPSPYWYDADQFFELLQAAGPRPVRDFVSALDGCSGPKAGKIAAAYKGSPCSSLSRSQAQALLLIAREAARPVRHERLGAVGELPTLPPFYAVEKGTFRSGAREPRAEIPFVVEAWAHAENAKAADARAYLQLLVNRTPITGDIRVYREKDSLELWGCGLQHKFKIPKATLDLTINITTPFCPITTDGKEPDLAPFAATITDAVERAAKRARRAIPKGTESGTERLTQKAIILEHLLEGAAKASGGNKYRFGQRQLFYVLRPLVIEALGVEPSWSNFKGIITDYEDEHGDIPGMYRDPRGVIYHPHLKQEIPIGTLTVEKYERPKWTFHTLLYIEKEGFFQALKDVQWPERHDCALLTSKGFSTRAARDLVDRLAESDEPVRVFCIHDADAAGTMIFQTLQEATKARGRRKVEIVNLGLEPWEALDMGLGVEPFKPREQRAAVARYVEERDDGKDWPTWLQANRVELNMMTTPQFLAWLDRKMAEYGVVKVIPPEEVLRQKTTDRLTQIVRERITQRILENAGLENLVAAEIAEISIQSGAELSIDAGEWLHDNIEDHWTAFVDEVATELADASDGARPWR